ncbi:hypothetical protein AB835_03875 [Candidatus Endobugula sertula]|uniref:Uncharacterized protein n=1 Tax=Candidatus Endobugula sertula TaxID=62101 RepID=A0A1D2QS97_9GAMM|nr:hypothetical protein AB835_03875 [Candidatus Endobugula sertula]
MTGSEDKVPADSNPYKSEQYRKFLSNYVGKVNDDFLLTQANQLQKMFKASRVGATANKMDVQMFINSTINDKAKKKAVAKLLKPTRTVKEAIDALQEKQALTEKMLKVVKLIFNDYI